MHLIDAFAVRAKNYLDKIDDNPVYPGESAIDNLERLNTTLQQESIDPDEVLSLLDMIGSPATIKSAGGRYFGFVTGGSLPAAMSAKLLSVIWDQNAALTVMSPVAAKLEEIAGKWLIDVFGLPAGCGFGFVTGDTMANFTVLAAARHRLLKTLGWNVEEKGLFGAPEVTVIAGDEVHISVLKALALLGFGRERIVRVPVDPQGRILAERIPETKAATIICLQAGNVNTGSFDDVETVCERFKNQPVWIHVDAAFGLWAAASNNKKQLVSGIERADSWALDAHKWLNVPYDSGVAFVRDKEALFAAMSSSAAYLASDTIRDPFNYVPEMSRQARAIPIWAALRSLGRSGLATLIDTNCRQAAKIAAALKDAGFSILNEVNLNQVLVSFGDAAVTLEVIKKVQREGICWCGSTVWQGKTAMRISVSCWRTTDEDIDLSLQSIIRQAQQSFKL